MDGGLEHDLAEGQEAKFGYHPYEWKSDSSCFRVRLSGWLANNIPEMRTLLRVGCHSGWVDHYLPYPAVASFSGRQSESLENGNFPIDSRRFSGIRTAKARQLVARRLLDGNEAPYFAGFLGA